MNDKELLQKAIDEGDFTLAQQLIAKLNNPTQKVKKGRLSKQEISQIQKFSIQGKSVSEIASILNRSEESIQKHFTQTNPIAPVKQRPMGGRVQFVGNTFQDTGKDAKGDKKIDQVLSGNTPKSDRRDKPPRVLSTCSGEGCGKQEEIPPHLANSDPDSRKIYHICSDCIKAAKGKLTR